MNKHSQYVQDSLRTKSANFQPDSIHPDLIHAILGIQTQSAQLLQAAKKDRIDEINVAEQIGDICWYLAIAYAHFGTVMNDNYYVQPKISQAYLNTQINERVANLNILSGKLIDILKRSMYYGKGKETPSIKNIESIIDEVWIQCVNLASDIGYNIDDIMNTNINKLKTRFPDKFSTQNVFNRNLQAQRTVLGGI